MRKSRWILAIAWLAVVVLFKLFEHEVGDPETERRPAVVQPPEAQQAGRRGAGEPQTAPSSVPGGAPLPPPSSGDPSTEIEMGPCEGTCSGTAFSLDRGGLWMTARHVVEGCRVLGIIVDGRRARRVERVYQHPAADVALLWTGAGAPALSLASYPLRQGQEGFSFGFPQGEPGAVRGKLLGRMRIRSTGSGRFVAPAIAWAEVARVPSALPKLGGISGGPFLDDSGTVIGVAIASSRRRGRLVSAAPVSLFEALEQAGASAGRRGAPPESPPAFVGGSFSAYGKALRSELSVSQVYCQGQKRPSPIG